MIYSADPPSYILSPASEIQAPRQRAIEPTSEPAENASAAVLTPSGKLGAVLGVGRGGLDAGVGDVGVGDVGVGS